MTIKNKFQILAAVALAMGMQSCEDFLDKLPDDRTEIDSVDKVQKLLMTAYPTCNYSWICELSSDNLMDNQTPHLPSNPTKKQVTTYYNFASYDRWHDQMFSFDAPSLATYGSSDSPGSMWSGFYSSIASCNYALETLDALREQGEPETDKTRALRAEAQILRAYSHFCLVNIFSQAYLDDASNAANVGVPYVYEPETTMIKEYDRGTVKETYEKIQQDLEAALPYISSSYNQAPKYHFNEQAAHAFASRFYLFTHQWDKVIEHANEVLGTDSTSVEKVMMDFTPFDECSTSSDYGLVWQEPTQPSNLLLLATYSLLGRYVFGYRYSIAGEKAADVLLVRTADSYWSGYIAPSQAIIGGMIFSSSSRDYGFYSCKIDEQFQYTNKLAGIGYPHIIQRAFTTASLLLERAEAKLMKGDIAGCSEDLCLYWNSPYKHCTEKTKTEFQRYYTMLDDSQIQKYFNQYIVESTDKNGLPVYKRKISSRNCYTLEEWQQFAAAAGNVYTVTDETLPYWNCINEFRRFENHLEGNRFFDLKRWAIAYDHTMGSNSDVYTMESQDTRRALEVAWESIAAGLESSRDKISENTRTGLSLNRNELVVTE